MAHLLFLSKNEFVLQQNILCTRIPDLCIILFYAQDCPFSKRLLSIFVELPKCLAGAYFGVLNMMSNKEVYFMAKESSTPITNVPYILCYYKGIPIQEYNGPATKDEICKFLIALARYIHAESSSFEEHTSKQSIRPMEPTYQRDSKPLRGFNDDDSTYLEFQEAYTRP